MKKVLSYLNYIEEVLLVVLFICMTIVCFMQVICRYVLKSSLIWSEEFLRACLVWTSCLGISCAYKRHAHLGVDFFMNLLPKKAQKGFGLIAYIISFIFMVLLIKIGYDFTTFQIAANRMTTSLHVSQAVVTAAIPVSGALSCIRILQTICKDYIFSLKNGKEEGVQ